MPDPSLNPFDWNSLAQAGIALLGVLVGAAFTVIGVHLTNRSNQRNLQLQLEHDEAKRRREYELSVRRDVYLEAAQTIAAGINAISKFAHLELDHSDVVKEFEERSSSLARVHIVATEKTAAKLTVLSTRLGAAFIRLNTERAALQTFKRRMNEETDVRRGHNVSRDQHLELMKQLNLSGERNDQRMEYLQRAFSFDQDNALQAAIRHDEILDQLRPRHIEFVKACLAEQAVLRMTLLPLIEAVREELEMPIDVALYAKAMPQDPAFTDQQLVDLFNAGDERGVDSRPAGSVLSQNPSLS
jgi:hypothetical protein